MYRKQLITISVEHLINVIDVNTLVNSDTKNQLSNIYQKTKKLDDFYKNTTIQLVTSNINKACTTFSSNDVLYVRSKDELVLLNMLYTNGALKSNDMIHVLFIEDKYFDKLTYVFYDYIIPYAKYVANKNDYHNDFESLFRDSLTTFVKKCRKSILSTIFGVNSRKRYYLTNYTSIQEARKNKNIRNKYINLTCPICLRENQNNKKNFTYEVKEKTIDEVIKIDKRQKKITFKCLHKSIEKSFIEPFSIQIEDYINYLPNTYSNLELQMWFIDNFKMIFDDKK